MYVPLKCNTPTHFPYICNACDKERNCRINHYIYQAAYAQKQYERTLVKSRQGINMTPEELSELNELISPLVLKGQPLSHIFAVHADEIPVCRRTLYNYFDRTCLGLEISIFQDVFDIKRERNNPNHVKKYSTELSQYTYLC